MRILHDALNESKSPHKYLLLSIITAVVIDVLSRDQRKLPEVLHTICNIIGITIINYLLL